MGSPVGLPIDVFDRLNGVLQQLCDDLSAEHDDLDSMVSSLRDEQWRWGTPADGWTVADQVSHLAFFDRTGSLALTDEAAFGASTAQLIADAANGDPSRVFASLPAAELVRCWREHRASLVTAAANASPQMRVPWYGPPMSPASFVSARLMETWAHGQDIADAIHQQRVPTARLRHIAQLAVRARPYAYRVHRRQLPDVDVHVALTAPDGTLWQYGAPDASNRVRGTALDFCLLATQRRHRDDVALNATGGAADEWLSIAQAFAGPAGPGRARLS
jgi:uncharacterized protein (TIGR03084 family)